MKPVTILLTPSYSKTARNMGYEEGEDINSYGVLFQQGYDIEELEVQPGEEFSIDENWENGTLNCDGKVYRLLEKQDFGGNTKVESSDQIHFEKGAYLFHADGKTFQKTSDDFIF
jgi:hypothetical protein